MTELPSSLPLCVDLDGTLLRTDSLHETLVGVGKRSWWSLGRLPGWLARGIPHFKREVANASQLNVALLPLNDDVVEIVKRARAAGRRTVLVTAATESLARQVAARVGLFDDVVATGTENIKGARKAAELERRFGRGGFVYVGDSRADLPVWAASGGAVVVSTSPALARAAASVATVVEVIRPATATFADYLRAIRLHQWVKNLLVLVPLLASHRAGQMPETGNALLAAIAFCLCASAVYVVNDLLDLEADREHPRKRARPFASGAIPIIHGLVIAPLMFAAGAAVATLLSAQFRLALAGYLALTFLYSGWLKARAIVDVMVLTSLYTLRIIAGGAATGIEPSFWLLAFSMSLFLSLAIVKRYSEILSLSQRNDVTVAGRGYVTGDLPLLMSLGTASGLAAVLVLALYVNSPEVGTLYPHQWALWMVLPAMLYWISRTWMKTCRGDMHDDPVVFATTDGVSWFLAALVAAALWVATGR